MLKNKIDILILGVFLPLLVIMIFIFTSAVPILFMFTLCFYYALLGLLKKVFHPRVIVVILSIVICLIFISRLKSSSKLPDNKDLTLISIFQVEKGQSIEQDFLIPKNNWRLNRLLNNKDIEVVLRLLIDADIYNSYFYINGKKLGTIASLLIKKTGKFYSYPVYNYIVKLPKEIFFGVNKITVKITSTKDYSLAYSSGIHPFPVFSHCRLIKTDGSVQDISNNYYHRRFRFDTIIYLISTKYFTKDKDPLIMGTIF